MSVELAHQKADKHLCVAHHRKVRIRLHPSKESHCGIVGNKRGMNLKKNEVIEKNYFSF